MRTLSRKDKESLSKKMGAFLQQYGRKAQKGKEPNDRGYDRGMEQILRKLKPEELDLLLNGDGDDEVSLSASSDASTSQSVP